MRLRTVLLFACTAVLASCGDDEEDLGPPTRYGIMNSLDSGITVQWNGDPSSSTYLGPDYFTFVGSVRPTDGTPPGVNDSPLWCLRVFSGGGGLVLFYGSDIPNSAYVHVDQGSGGSNIYLVDITEQFLAIPQSPTNCMSLAAEPAKR